VRKPLRHATNKREKERERESRTAKGQSVSCYAQTPCRRLLMSMRMNRRFPVGILNIVRYIFIGEYRDMSIVYMCLVGQKSPFSFPLPRFARCMNAWTKFVDRKRKALVCYTLTFGISFYPTCYTVSPCHSLSLHVQRQCKVKISFR